MQRNQELFHLREQAAMLEHARNRLDQLVFQQQELREKARQLDALRVKESNDVDKLQGRSLYHLFYRVSGSDETATAGTSGSCNSRKYSSFYSRQNSGQLIQCGKLGYLGYAWRRNADNLG